MKNEYTNWDLLAKYIAGEVSAKEQLEVETWIAEDKKNLDEFSKLTSLLQEVPKKSFTPNVDAAWQKLQVKIKQENSNIKEDKKPGNSLFLWSRIAAMVVFAVGISFLFYSIYVNNIFNTDTLIASGNEVMQVDMPDGSIIWLNKNSSVTYSKSYGENDRAVSLSGEAFFDVSKDENRPFIISAAGTETRVLGTSFNIKSNEQVELNVYSGKVLFKPENEDDEKGEVLTKGKKAVFSAVDKTISVSEDNDPNLLSWKNKKLVFKQNTLEYILKTTGNYFGKELIMQGDIANCTFTGEFENPDLEEVLDVLSITLNLSISETKDKKIIFSGAGCN
jgi:transmembrane sensor